MSNLIQVELTLERSEDHSLSLVFDKFLIIKKFIMPTFVMGALWQDFPSLVGSHTPSSYLNFKAIFLCMLCS